MMSVSATSSPENPGQFCETENCTEAMKDISQHYKAGQINFIKQPLRSYSGNCFHLNPDYDAEHTHHGAFAFKTQGETTTTNGVFSFFSETDPYQNMSAAELANYLGDDKTYAPLRAVEIDGEPHFELSFLTVENSIRYWFRSSPDFQRLFLIGQNAGVHYASLVFCEFNLHQTK
ncbi:MAG: hypothetical protein H7061_04300 [Bdellovibrionaceae bacterium]|nr:hypothetical protein [Bdellovibrio sp.]